jgi:hypothetical protein
MLVIISLNITDDLNRSSIDPNYNICFGGMLQSKSRSKDGCMKQLQSRSHIGSVLNEDWPSYFLAYATPVLDTYETETKYFKAQGPKT